MNKKSKLDLLVRVRYLNPLPPPPFPPKLLTIHTDINRLGEPSYLNQLAASTPLPMLVDAEMGMPLDLNAYDGVWDGNDLALNPTLDPSRSYDPADLALLAPIRTLDTETRKTNSKATAEVSWMRNSSYITRKNTARRREAADAADRSDALVDASEAAQIAAIDLSFHELASTDSMALQHPDPKKKDLRVVETYDILPDSIAWANQYIMVRYPEKPVPGASSDPSATSASSALLASAILRPIREEDQQIMEYYLPGEDDLERLAGLHETPLDEDRMAKMLERVEQDSRDPVIDEIFPNVHYNRIRTYDVVSQNESAKEVLITIEEEGASKKRKRGAYFKDISMKTLLRKTRVNRAEDVREGTWDVARIGYRRIGEHELADWQATQALSIDPTWADAELRRLNGENVIEGQGEAVDEDGVEIVDEGADRAEAEVHSDD